MGLTNILGRLAEAVDHRIGWMNLPVPLGIAVLMGLRSRMRRLNLQDAGAEPVDVPRGTLARARTVDGAYTDAEKPAMGCEGSAFGRNVPLDAARPEPDEDVVGSPSPRAVSERLLARRGFAPATSLNMLAAAWIQFEVHDWVDHGAEDATTAWDVPLAPGDSWGEHPMRVRRLPTVPTVLRGRGSQPGPPAVANKTSHWWDAGQIYGPTAAYADAIRTREGGRIALDATGLPHAATDRLLDPRGTVANFWVGLALLHSLFLEEHNAICAAIAREHPEFDDQRLYDAARLVVAAVIAKIHTVEWTPAVIAHPTTRYGMRASWFGLLGERVQRRFGNRTRSDFLQGIPGSKTDHDGVDYSLTEEFVAVYRMHPLIPDTIAIGGLDGSAPHETPVADLLTDRVRPYLEEHAAQDLLYSFGRAHPGALQLHNFPDLLRDFHRIDGRVDLATADILRTRERGVPRYNEFRRRLRLRPVRTFLELTGDVASAAELEEVYGDVDRVDTMVGLYAEAKPKGFAFGDTAFRIFLLMASRRLRSDRFFTDDFRSEVYTKTGMRWIDDASFRSVLLRHHPELAPALDGVRNPFAPWKSTVHEQRTYIEYRADLEQIPPDEAATIEKMVRSLRSDSEYATKKFHRGLRDAHAKAHALLRGDLVIEPDLPEELAQGLFARPGIYPVVARLSTTSGAIRHDRIRGIRGFAVKVLGVEGERCRADGADTHDMLFVSHAGFPFADAKSYSFGGMLSAWLLARLPDGVLYPIELLLSGLRQCHVRLGPALDLVSHPNTHILGLSFFTAAPLRYGRYVARLRVVPSSPEVRALVGKPPIARGHDAFADDVQAFYARSAAEYEVQAQLCTDLAAMPIEDVRHEWPEDLSPFRTVARLSFPQQDPHTPERLEFGENLSFTPFTGLAAHRPLGSINRLKLRVYDSSSGYRHSVNGVARIEPSINELPQ